MKDEAITPGNVVQLSPLVRRVTAPNPGVMTGPGTNTYLIGTDALALIDPGPESAPHLSALLEAAGKRLIKWILCTHTHLDHSPGARALKAETGAELLGYRQVPDDGRQDAAFAPDRSLREGDTVDCGVFRLRAVHTPGHASNHLCYLLEEERWLFTGDHIMQGSTVVISPPDGDMTAYLHSLERLLALDLAALAPGHGKLIDKPHEEVRKLIAHRTKRERKVVAAFGTRNPATLDDLLPLVYDDVSPGIYPVARRSLHAHLLKLKQDGRAVEEGGRWMLR
jgi:glyoxylase-like metal-dependent hydrolase (beta-lactamase superfamily II)